MPSAVGWSISRIIHKDGDIRRTQLQSLCYDSFSTSDKTFTSIGINLIAGARYFVTPRMALFGEFKYNRATIHTESLQGDYSAQLFVFGISIHFDRPAPSSSSPGN